MGSFGYKIKFKMSLTWGTLYKIQANLIAFDNESNRIWTFGIGFLL